MKRLLLLVLVACHGRAPPASQPVPGAVTDAPPPPPRPLAKPATKCSEWLEEALFEQIEGGRDVVLETRLERCEKTLLTPEQQQRVAKVPGGLLEALAMGELKELNREEVAGYLGLVSRYALARGVKRLIYYGLRLRPAFDAVNKVPPKGVCDTARREQALFLLLAPKALGGQEDAGLAILKQQLGQPRCPIDQYVLIDAMLLRGEVKRAELAFAELQKAKPAAQEAAVFERVRATLNERLQRSRRNGN